MVEIDYLAAVEVSDCIVEVEAVVVAAAAGIDPADPTD